MNKPLDDDYRIAYTLKNNPKLGNWPDAAKKETK